MTEMTPREIVEELDKHIVGQKDAKRAVAIALRNRWRRMQLDESVRREITPKNILMIGPTGVGKTEIARRLARLANAPFIKVEATKFTEVGYVGREVDSIIRDLMDISINPSVGVEIMAPPGMEEMTSQLQGLFQNLSGQKTSMRKMRVSEAVKILTETEASNLINDDDIKTLALEKVEQNGIVFLDEIDKIVGRSSEGHRGVDVSREGVQRDLLPLVEGSTVSTKYGMIKTDHILFIASGAFQLAKPSDLIPELQGRLPIRVELRALSIDDFVRILTEPDVSLTEQYTALMNTEGVELVFAENAVRRIAEIAWQVNEQTENIGARRLHTVMERLLEVISFEAADSFGQKVEIDVGYVDRYLSELAEDQDLSRYIL